MVKFLKDISKGYAGRFPKNKRLLQERSHLAVEFPQTNNRVYRTYIPMLENASISEKGRANLNDYNLIGRAGQLFSYANSDSRKISLSFNISLLHVMEVDTEEGISDKFKRQFNLFFDDKKQQAELFQLKEDLDVERFLKESGFSSDNAEDIANLEVQINNKVGKGDFDIKDPKGLGRPHAAINRNYYRSLIGKVTGADVGFGEELDSDTLLGNINDFIDAPTASDSLRRVNNTIDLIYVWVNLIRATILNNSSNALYGPPIVRLTHGPMYNNVPCLVENYDIKIVDEAGYEAETLTPKKIEVTLNLVESRTGNFGAYQAGQIENGDNLTGWESIISNNEIDPYNGLITGENWTT